MAKTRYAPDRGLTARMTLTMFLLGVVFVAFITVLVLILGATNRVSSGGIVFIAVVVGLALGIGSFWYSDKIALSTAGAQVVTPQDGPQAARLHGIVDRLTALANMPKPRLAIAPSPMLNAFATGRNEKTSVLVATTGLLNSNLDDRELEAVLAHELSHVAHKDVAVMTIASFIGIIAGLLVRFAFYSELFGGGGRSNNNNNNGGALPVVLVVLVVGIVTYAVSFLLIRLLSRYRELAADRAGALLTGQPSALASALQKVSGSMNAIPTKDLRAAEPLNAFYFIPAFKKNEKGPSLNNLFSTHPSLERRLRQLSEISEQLSK
ncbi:MAG TPA: zinc metalloprotease HtpX [Streptosporangiaceae bacterium]|jgi:heat shock protein HtpX|nr:zinc metalloprotease HtpX [Streptosporangiaceae bacterium]